MPDQRKLQVIVGSTRPDRAAELVVPWVVRRATDDGRFHVELLDLRDWRLPMFQETFETVGDFADPTFSLPIVRDWNRKLAEADAYVFVTTEYNHSVPGELKNALDSVFVSYALRNKPAAMVGYSTGPLGAGRAIEHLALIALEEEMVPLRNTVLVGRVQDAFNNEGNPSDQITDAAMTITLDDLAWWADILTPARAAGELPPGAFRIFAATMALTDQRPF
jgi:NAD(P)H-dependent FMN reductase